MPISGSPPQDLSLVDSIFNIFYMFGLLLAYFSFPVVSIVYYMYLKAQGQQEDIENIVHGPRFGLFRGLCPTSRSLSRAFKIAVHTEVEWRAV